MCKLMKLLLALWMLVTWSANVYGESLHYNIVAHAKGADCDAAKNYLTSTQLYEGTSEQGVPNVTDTELTYTVESLAEAIQLCQQVGGEPAELLPVSDASNYQPSTHPWMSGQVAAINVNDNSCAQDEVGNNYTYLELAGSCNP